MSCNSTTYDTDNVAEAGICAYDLPSGMTANLTNLEDSGGMGTGFQVFPSPDFHYDSTQADKLYVSNFELVGMPAGTQLDDDRWQNKSDSAYECALWACVQAFDTSQVNGNQKQVVRGTWDKVDNSSIMEFYGNISFVDLPADMNVPSDINFYFHELAKTAMINFFYSLFEGNITVNQGTQRGSSDIVQALWNATGDIDTWMQNVATSLTNVVRAFDHVDSRADFDGTGYRLGYDVRWQWIILPAIIVSTSLLLLIIVIVRTALSDIYPWKGSPLVLLMMHVDSRTAARANGTIERYNGIENSVGKSEMFLGKDGNGVWGLKQT